MNIKANSAKYFCIILLLGIFVRLAFLFHGAELYYGSPTPHIGGDTMWWIKNIVNLIKHGTYTDLIGSEYGYFTRTPGFSFFIGFFYLLCGKNIALTLKLVVAAQIFLDTLSICFIYKITLRVFKKELTALTVMLLYALYPFAIVWNARVYAETLSVFLFLASVLLFLNAENKRSYFFSGVVFSLAVLTRIQIIVFIPSFLLIAFYVNYRKYKKWLHPNFLSFALAVLLVYGAWPARNYFGHGKLIFAQHLGDKAHWSPDYMYFMYYIWSVQTDHEPQFSQIMKGEKVTFPKTSYKHIEDTALLNRIEVLTESCGEGFSYFRRSLKFCDTVVQRGQDCNLEIVDLFKTLIEHQKKYNAFSYYIAVPLSNLHKAIFKRKLEKTKSRLVYNIGLLLFTYRTFLLFLGVTGLVLIFFTNRAAFFSPGILIIVSYVVSWYLFQSFVYRNMEIRFLLQADVLLLIPGGWLLTYILYFFQKNFFRNQ